MQLGLWGEFFLKLTILFAGVYVIIILTPKIAAFIDKRRKPGKDASEEPRPERVQEDDSSKKDDNTQNSI